MNYSHILPCISLVFAFLWTEAAGAEASRVDVIKLTGPIGPVSVQQVSSAIERAEDDQSECLVVMLDTPGGLLDSTQLIIKDILASNVPVVVYVAPSGAGAGSAGVFITMSAHVAAMAPGTSIGAAHPVSAGGAVADSVMNEKIENFSASYIRSIAEKHGRNADWAEQAVRKSVALTDREAVEQNVVDLNVATLDSLLVRIDGTVVEVREGSRVLRTKDAEVQIREMDWHHRVLHILSNPNIAYLLMMLGFYGLIYEFINPGAIFPGVVGGMCVIIGLFALQTLPINYAGLLLLLLGLGLFVTELFVVSGGLLALGGAISFTIGSMMLIDSPYPYLRISLYAIIPAVIATGTFVLFAAGYALRAQKRRTTTGDQGLIGETGDARTAVDARSGSVFVHGEYWSATSAVPVESGAPVRVVGINGLRLQVERMASKKDATEPDEAKQDKTERDTTEPDETKPGEDSHGV